MAEIHNTAVNPGGVPLRYVTVTIELSSDEGDALVDTVEATDHLIHNTFTTTTDSDGFWSATVVSNNLITPNQTAYKITEDGTVFYVVLPADAEYWVGDILVDTPAWES